MTVRFASPLRYPGGKGALAPFLARLIAAQRPRCTLYVEPFAGGAGAALRLLFNEQVDAVLLNDIDPGISAFWRAVLMDNGAFIDMIEHCELSIDEWTRQREIYADGQRMSDLEFGFATFYLNRTNRSGIIDARPIGGLNQTGRWLLDARFNRKTLAERVRDIGRFKSRIEVSSQDGIELTQEFLASEDDEVFLYADPPYLDKGSDLYLDTLKWDDHLNLAKILNASIRCWMISYDIDPRVRKELFPKRRCARFAIKHTAGTQHMGSEYVIFSDRTVIDDLRGLSTGRARFQTNF